LDVDLLPERSSELEVVLLPDFDWAGDLDTDLDLLEDCDSNLEPDVERDLDRLLKRLPERDRLSKCERLLDRDLLPERDLDSTILDLERLHEILLDFDLNLRKSDLDGLLDLRLPECERDLEL